MLLFLLALECINHFINIQIILFLLQFHCLEQLIGVTASVGERSLLFSTYSALNLIYCNSGIVSLADMLRFAQQLHCLSASTVIEMEFK